MKNKNNKCNTIFGIKGFTLVELLITTGIIGLAGLGVYAAYAVASDNNKAKSETQSLFSVIRNLDNYSIAKGDLEGITLSNLHNFTQNFIPNLELTTVSSTSDSIRFNYANINTRICNNFVSKMISGDKNITSIVNGMNINSNNLSEIAQACESNIGLNSLSVIYSKPTSSNPITVVTANLNAPDTPPPDILVPVTPTPAIVPQVPGFVPSTAIPVVYGITGTAPVYPIIPPVGGGGPPIPGPGTGTGPSIPPFIPPEIPDPGEPEQPPEDVPDQNPLPPPPISNWINTRTINVPVQLGPPMSYIDGVDGHRLPARFSVDLQVDFDSREVRLVGLPNALRVLNNQIYAKLECPATMGDKSGFCNFDFIRIECLSCGDAGTFGWVNVFSPQFYNERNGNIYSPIFKIKEKDGRQFLGLGPNVSINTIMHMYLNDINIRVKEWIDDDYINCERKLRCS